MIRMSAAQLHYPVLITGSNGFIGTRVVKTLLDFGFTDLRCFVRPSSRIESLRAILASAPSGTRAQLITGDLLSREDCTRAAEGVSIVYHLAAGFDRSFAGAFMNSALATRNLMDAVLAVGHCVRFVDVSSFAVYSNIRMRRGALLDENAPLEDSPAERYDPYGFGKRKQEDLVREYGQRFQLPFVILRPGVVFGPGKRDLSGRVGANTFGFLLHVGGANVLPLTYVDNCAEAIVLAGLREGIEGETFNIVDDELLTSSQMLRAYKKRVKGLVSIRLPYPLAYGLCALWEKYARWTKGQLPPVFNRRRCAAEWKGNRYTNAKARDLLGWTPRVPMKEALANFLAQFDRPVA